MSLLSVLKLPNAIVLKLQTYTKNCSCFDPDITIESPSHAINSKLKISLHEFSDNIHVFGNIYAHAFTIMKYNNVLFLLSVCLLSFIYLNKWPFLFLNGVTFYLYGGYRLSSSSLIHQVPIKPKLSRLSKIGFMTS